MGNFTFIRAIALTALQETLRKRVFYVVAFLMVLCVILFGSSMAFMHMATAAGETKIVDQMRSQMVAQVLGIWKFAALFLALFLGATGFSSEIANKTIVNVLSRPVERSTYLFGRWLGVLAFLWAFVLAGILIALLVACIFDVQLTAMLWLGLLEMFVSALFYSGISLALSVVMPPVVAGGVAFFVILLPSLGEDFLDHPNVFLRLLADAIYYLSPAVMPVNLISESFSKQMLDPNYSLYIQVLAEHLLYAAAVFLVACIVFGRRELRLR